MPITTAPELLAALRQFRLLSPSQLNELTRKLEGKSLDPRTLVPPLVKQGWLTPYQVNQLFQGRGVQLLLGSYVLLERLGEGGMGEVFKARNWKLGKIVALKVMRKDRLANETAVKRFQREGRAAAQLSHANIVHTFDADQVGDTNLFVMEYIEGIDLAKLVKDKGPLPIAAACEYIRQAACGLEHAHEKSMVHRDIKPHNLLLAKDGTVKILDMGLARMAQIEDDEESSSTLTKEGSVMGTLDYIAPEQAMDSHTVDIRADLYSLGCTFYFLLTGKVPFPGGDALAKLMKHKLEEPPPVEKLRSDVPPSVAAVVRKLLAKQPERRYQTPAELVAVLAGGNSPTVIASQDCPKESPSAATGELAETVAFDTTIRAQRWVRHKRLALLGGVGGLMVCLGLLGLFLFLGTGSQNQVRSPQEEGWVRLFNGTDLSGWVVDSGDPQFWSIRNGELEAKGATGNQDLQARGWLLTDKDYADFILRLEFKLFRGGNSGVTFRTKLGAAKHVEVQIHDDGDPRYFKIAPNERTGSLCFLAIDRLAALKPLGEWNRMEIEVRGRSLRVAVNGQETLQTDLDKFAAKADTWAGLTRSSGRVGLQNWNASVNFRNIEIKELTPSKR